MENNKLITGICSLVLIVCLGYLFSFVAIGLNKSSFIIQALILFSFVFVTMLSVLGLVLLNNAIKNKIISTKRDQVKKKEFIDIASYYLNKY